MTDENNMTPAGEESREVVSWYVPREQGAEVVHCYVQPEPLPQSVRPQPQAAPAKKKKKGWVVFVILAAVLAAAVGLTALLVSIFSDDSPSVPDDGSAGSIVDISGSEHCLVPVSPPEPSVRMELAAPLETALTPAEVYRKVGPSTVTVLATNAAGTSSMGTGVLLTEDGYFITNAHVVSGAVSSMIILDTGVTYEAKLVGYAPERDIAVLKAQEAEGLTPAEFGDSDYCSVGETAYAIGNPLNLKLRATFTNGMISGLERQMELDGRTLTMIQTNAAVNNGNSGGPLINEYGQVIGIITMKMSRNGSGAEATVEGLCAAHLAGGLCGQRHHDLRRVPRHPHLRLHHCHGAGGGREQLCDRALRGGGAGGGGGGRAARRCAGGRGRTRHSRQLGSDGLPPHPARRGHGGSDPPAGRKGDPLPCDPDGDEVRAKK